MLKLVTFGVLFLFSLSAMAQPGALTCQSLLSPVPKIFGYTNAESWGLQIYHRELRELKDAMAPLRAEPWPQAKEDVLAKDLRRYFFHLRILSQTFAAKDPKFFEAQTARFKSAERLLGRISMLRNVETFAKTADEPVVAAYLQKLEKQTSKDLKEVFENLGALDSTGTKFEDVIKSVENYKHWTSAKAERKFLIDEIFDHIQDLNKKVHHNEFDRADIEEGLHELRRSLREIVLRTVNLQNLAVIADEGPLPTEANQWFEELQKTNPLIFESPYMPDSEPEINTPIVLPKKLMAMITEIVNEVGLTKDEQEPALFLVREIKDIPDFKKEDEQRLLGKIKGALKSQEGHRKIANELQERLRNTRLLELYADFFKRQK